MRLFIAAELAPPISAALRAAQQQLRRAAPPVRWAAPESLHLTLVFLGEVPPAALPPVAAALHTALADSAAFALELGAPGAFPNMRQPRVLWVGVAGDLPALGLARAALVAALTPLGFPGDPRPFQPHLTLGRVADDATPAQRAQLGAQLAVLAPPPPLAWRVRQISLFQSEQLPAGARYTIQATATLG